MASEMLSPDQNIVSGKSSPLDAWYYVDRNGQVGPLALQELRDTLSTFPTANAHDVLVWHKGLIDWKHAKDVSELNDGETLLPPPLPKMDLPASSRIERHFRTAPLRAVGLRRRWVKTLLGGVALLAALWIVWPYYAAYSLFIAFRDGDVSVLEDRVAWDSVRQGLRDDVNAMFLETLRADTKKDSSAQFGAGLAAILGPTIINQVVDSYVTPQAIAAVKHAEASRSSAKEIDNARIDLRKTVQEVGRLRLDQVPYAFFSGGPTTFRIDVLPENDPPLKNPVKLLFKWSGDWKLTRILLPPDVFDANSAD
jgi:hypothetical protein